MVGTCAFRCGPFRDGGYRRFVHTVRVTELDPFGQRHRVEIFPSEGEDAPCIILEGTDPLDED